MRVTKLALRNFRGINRDFDLPAACIVAGPNFSGKSTVPIALRLACVGSMPPPIGKTGIWPAFAGNADEPGKMSVTATTDAGLSWTLEWEKKKESVSQRGQPPESCTLPPVLCDPATFWSMTGAEQTRAIFAASGATVRRETLLEAVQSVDGSPARVRDEVVATLGELLTKRLDANPEVSAATTLWLSDCSQLAKEERAKVKRLEAKTAATFWSGPIPADKTKELRAAREKLAQLTRHEQSLRQAAASAADAASKAEKTRARLSVLDAILNAPQQPEPPALTEEDVERFAKAEEMAAELSAEVAKAVAEYDRMKLTRERLKSGTCPCCGNTGPGLADIDRALRSDMGKWSVDTALTKTQLQKASDELAAIEARNKAIDKTRREWERHRDDLEALRRERASIAELAPVPEVPTTPEAIVQAKEECDRQTDLVAELEGAQGEFARWAAIRDERDKAEADLIRARCTVEVVTEAAKKVGEKLDEAAGAAFGGTLKIANRLCEGLIASPLEFRDGMLGRKASKEDVQRTGGTVREGAWIPHTSFSGTEALIGYAGFAVAVASKAPFRLVVMDELNRLTSDRKRSLVARMLLLISEGVVDQFVGCDPEAAETFTLIDAARWEF